MNIGETLRDVLHDNKMSQRELADKCGLSTSYISEIKNGGEYHQYLFWRRYAVLWRFHFTSLCLKLIGIL